jgi:hypothetical protein
MEEKRLTEHESLLLIQQMIQTAKDDHRESGEGWLLWGWLLFIGSILSAILYYLDRKTYLQWVWWGILFIGLTTYLITWLVKKKKEIVTTYVHSLLNRLETGFFISLFAIIAGIMLGGNAGFAFGYFYILYAFWMFIHGAAIRFRPLMIGALVNWAAAICIFIVKDFMYDMIISAVAVLVGYLIPGYMLKAEYKKSLVIH